MGAPIEPTTPLGSLIREYRVAAGYLRTEDLAAKLNVSQATISHWETGRNRPKPRMMRRLHRVIGLPLDETYFEDGGSGVTQRYIETVRHLPVPDDGPRVELAVAS